MCERLDSVLPFGWSLKTLSDIAIDENGIVDGPFGSNLKVSDYVDDAENGVPVLTTKNLSGDYSRGTLRYVTKDKYDTLKRSTVFPGDILVAKIGSIGKCGIYPLTQKKALIPANLLKITLKEEYDRKFVFYYIQSGQFQKLIKSISTATAQPAFNVTKFRKLPVIIPPLEEQKRIVARIEELFSELDAAVATLERTKEQLAVYRQAVLKEAFEFEFADVVEIQSIVSDIRIGPFGTMLHKSDYIQGGVPVLNPQHIKNLSVIENVKVSVSLEKADELTSYRLRKNDILMGRRGEMGRVAAITEREDGWICGTGSIFFRLKPEYDAEFYVNILSSPQTVHYLEENATGTTMKNLNEEIVKHIPVPDITRELQHNTTEVLERKLSVCDKIEETVTKALQEAEAMRQSILKQAFAGEL